LSFYTPWAAEWSGNLAATLVFPLADGGLYLRGDYSFMGDHWTNIASAAQLESKDEQDRETVNGKLGWRNDNWDVSVWGKNLTDDEYAVQTLTCAWPINSSGRHQGPMAQACATISDSSAVRYPDTTTPASAGVICAEFGASSSTRRWPPTLNIA